MHACYMPLWIIYIEKLFIHKAATIQQSAHAYTHSSRSALSRTVKN